MSPSEEEAVADDGAASGQGRQLLLKVTVEVSADKSDSILVYEGDEPSDLALSFIRRNGLQDNLVGPLTAHILEHARKERSRPSGGPGVVGRQPGSSRRGAISAASSVEKPMSEGTPGGADLESSPASSMPTPARGGRARSKTPERLAGGGRAFTPLTNRGRPHTARTPENGSASARTDTTARNGSSKGKAEQVLACAEDQPVAEDAAVAEMADATTTPDRPWQSAKCTTTPDHGTEDGADRFELLHDDASQRRNRLDRLRQQVERDILDQRSRVQVAAPGSARCASRRDREVERTSERQGEADRPGDRLFRDAAKRQAKTRELQIKKAEQERKEELSEATFAPTIEASQRSWQGVGRSLQDPKGSKTKQKMESMRQMKEKSALDGCTFRPEIDPKSEMLMNRRIQRMQISGSLYEHLYEDAQRRQERQLEYNSFLPPGVTFQPQVNNSQIDYSREDSLNRSAISKSNSESRLSSMRSRSQDREDSINRLAYSKSNSESRLSTRSRSQDRLSQGSRSQPDFHPQTGRAPSVQRNKAGLPIGEFLYESGREKAALQSQENAAGDAERERSQCSASKVGEASLHLFEDSKLRKYKDLYEALSGQDPQRQLRFATLSLTVLDEELAEFLRPMFAYLKETKAKLDFASFCSALDYQRQHSAVPTSHLFVQRSSVRTSDKYRQDVDNEPFTPRTDPNSNRIASRHRPRSCTPLHDQLLQEKEAWDAKLQEQRLLQDERTLDACTFQPNTTSTSVGRASNPIISQSNNFDPRLGTTAIRLGGVKLTEDAAGDCDTPGNDCKAS